MWGLFRRKRDRRREALEQAMNTLEDMRKRFGQSKPRRGGGGAYSNAVGLGMGVLAIIVVLSLLYWRFRRTTEEAASDSNQ
jgi:hypothetical protein